MSSERENICLESERISVKRRAEEINQRLKEDQNCNKSQPWTTSKTRNGSHVNSNHFNDKQSNKNMSMQKIESHPETLVTGGERCGTKLQVNTGVGFGAKFAGSNDENGHQRLHNNNSNTNGLKSGVNILHGVASVSSSMRADRLSETQHKDPKIEFEGCRWEGKGTNRHTASVGAISVHQSTDGASRCDGLKTLSDCSSSEPCQPKDISPQEISRFFSSSKGTITYHDNSSARQKNSCVATANNRDETLSLYQGSDIVVIKRPSLFPSSNTSCSASSSPSNYARSSSISCAIVEDLIEPRNSNPKPLLLNKFEASSKNDECDCDSVYDSADSLFTSESIDQILCSCEKIRDSFQTEDSDADFRSEASPSDENVSKQEIPFTLSTNEHNIAFPEEPKEPALESNFDVVWNLNNVLQEDENDQIEKYVNELHVSPSDSKQTSSANDATKMEFWTSSLNINRRRLLKSKPSLRSYGSVSGIPTTTASFEIPSPKVHVRQRPELPAYLTLGRKRLRKSLSYPCEIADDRSACSTPEEPLKSELRNIIAELNFSKFKIDDEDCDAEEPLKIVSERPLLASIEKLGLKPAVNSLDMNKEETGSLETEESKLEKLRELTEKLKLLELNRPTFLHRSHSITPASIASGKYTDTDVIRSRSASLPRRGHTFLRSYSYSGAEDVSSDDNKAFVGHSEIPSRIHRKDNKYVALKSSTLPHSHKLNTELISNVPIECPMNNQLAEGMLELSSSPATDQNVFDEGFGNENESRCNSSSDGNRADGSDQHLVKELSVQPRNTSSLNSQEPRSSSFAEKRKRRKGMIFNGGNELNFDLSQGEQSMKSNSSGRSLTFPPQRKCSNSEEPHFTSIDSNGLKSLNVDLEEKRLQVSELSLADSHICPSELGGDETYHDVVSSVTRQPTRAGNKNSAKPLKKKHYSDPSGEKCIVIGLLTTESARNSDELTLPDLMLTSKSEPELGDSVISKHNGSLRLHIQHPLSSLEGVTQTGSQPNSPPAISYDPAIFNKANTIGHMTAPIRFENGNGFENKFYSLTKSPQQSRRYSKKRLRGPYGEMLEEEMRKSGEKQQQKMTGDLIFLQELIEPQAAFPNIGCVPRRRNCASIPICDLSGQQRAVDDINLQRSNSDTGTTPKRKISTNIPPLPVVNSESDMFLAPPQLSPSISVPNFVSIAGSPEWTSAMSACDTSATDNVEASNLFYTKHQVSTPFYLPFRF